MDTETALLDVRKDVDALRHDVTGIEHRLIQVVRNAYWAATQRDGWTAARRLEAGAALIRYLLVGRTMVVFGVGLGGILALHASFMLADQNRKLDLQNHLSVVASEIAEAQRNSQFAQLIPPIIEEVRQTKMRGPGQLSASDGAFDTLAVRIAVLTQTFQPYRWVATTVDGNVLLVPIGEGSVFSLVQGVRSAFDTAFGSSAMEPGRRRHMPLQVPFLTGNRYSPERGLILVNLHALQFDLRPLSAYNATFESLFAPGARLNGIQLGGLSGPDLSKPFSLAHSYLPHATFNRSSLGGVDFTGANLQDAELNSSDLVGINLKETKLSAARLNSSNLDGVTMDGTQLDSADLGLANLSNANLSRAIGLTTKQLAAACIDAKTTKLPAGMLPASYSVPVDCCSIWPSKGIRFALNAQGRCMPPSQLEE